jgi:hypothetical protein
MGSFDFWLRINPLQYSWSASSSSVLLVNFFSRLSVSLLRKKILKVPFGYVIPGRFWPGMVPAL